MNDKFWNPKSVFKGTRADGSKFKVEEWDFNSVGNLGGEFLTSLLVSAFIMVIASPIALILAVLTYNGKIGVANLVGIVIGLYFWFDASNGWLFGTLTNIFLTESTMSFMVAINIASVIAHLGLLFLTIVGKKEFNVFPMMWVLLFIIMIIFYKGYGFGKGITQEHGSYSLKSPELEIQA